jgi:hypothetical protein
MPAVPMVKVQRIRDELLVDAERVVGVRHDLPDVRRPAHESIVPAAVDDRHSARPLGSIGVGFTKHVGELGDHSRPAHRPTPRVGQFADVDRAGHVGVAMTEQERNLVDALAGEQRPTRDGVSVMRSSA